jgi:hypothetical protein
VAINNGQDLSNAVIRKPARIISGQTISSPLFIGGQLIVGIDCGTLLTSTAFTFVNSIDGGKTFKVVENAGDGTVFAVVTEANKYIHITPPIAGLDIVKLVAGSAEGADRTVNIILIP